MKNEEVYDELPGFVKENIKFPSNYMYLSRDQQEFVDSLVEIVCDFYPQPVKEELEYLKDELEQIIERI